MGNYCVGLERGPLRRVATKERPFLLSKRSSRQKDYYSSGVVMDVDVGMAGKDEIQLPCMYEVGGCNLLLLSVRST